MSYQVLARKWRPRLFREMVGQEHVLRALINALDQERLHHAYLFTGTRGVGKTTIARILAKCLNCETGISSEPCDQCSACVEISEGRFVDLIEVDAASKTKVEDTRELLENVQYSPTRGRYKVYLIDEVHMLSASSFNALLKTLEEPPPHVKFLLATTDPQKLPVTVLSRCLQFNLKHITPDVISKYLATILDKEHIVADQEGLWQLARAADGSMRDALSLTDQAIAFGNGGITGVDVNSMLGNIDQSLVLALIQALNSGEGMAVLEAVEKLAAHTPDYSAALQECQSLLYRIALAQTVPEAIDNSSGDREQILAFAAQIQPADVQLYYQIALQGRKDLPLAPDPRSGFEMTMLRMLAFKPETSAPVSNARGSQSPIENSDNKGIAVAPAAGIDAIKTMMEEEKPATKKSEAAPAAANSAARQAIARDIIASVTGKTDDIKTETVKNCVADKGKTGNGKHGVEESGAAKIASLEPGRTKPAASARQAVNPGPGAPKLEAREQSGGRDANVAVPATVDQLDGATWAALFFSLPVRGALQNTASHCELAGRNETHLFFTLDERNSTLYSEDHQQRLADILGDYFLVPVKVTVQVGAVESSTPAMIAQAAAEKRQAQAEHSIHNDPNVQQLINRFSARILDNSIKPVESKE